jgi:DNA-binding transcriptional LysR family regulator
MFIIHAMNLASFDLNLLKVLDALLREGSTVAAGRRVGLSQPAVSAALGRLRHALGDPLFVRHGPRLEPTDHARGLAGPLREILDRAEEVLAGPARFESARARDVFHLSASDFFTEMLVPPLMARLGAVAPRVGLRVTDRFGPGRLHETRDARSDLLILPEESGPPGWLDWTPAFRSGFEMVARAGHPALEAAGVGPGEAPSLDLFCALPQVRYAPRDETEGLEDLILAGLGRRREVRLAVPDFGSIQRVVAATDLVGILPRRLAAKAAAGEALWAHPLPFRVPHLMLGLYWPKRLASSPPQAWLRSEVLELLRPLDDGEGPG